MAKNEHSKDLYGEDAGFSKGEKIGAEAVKPKSPTLDVHGEKDSRFTKGN